MLSWWPGHDFLRALGWIYWGLVAALIFSALWYPRTRLVKVIGVGLVLGIMVMPVYLNYQELSQAAEVRKLRYQKAKALFDERCKTAGEKVYKRVVGVDGVLLANVRPDRLATYEFDLRDKNWADAALPGEWRGDWYIRSFIVWEHRQFQGQRGYLSESSTNSNGYSTFPGYEFVDVAKSDGQGFLRYSLSESAPSNIYVKSSEKTAAKYSVSYKNMDSASDRDFWVAGTKVFITDSKTGELLAEKTWYSFEPGQGSTAGFRSPWAFSEKCPEPTGWRGGSTRMFVDQVLIPNPRRK